MDSAPADGDEDDRSLGVAEPGWVNDKRQHGDEWWRHAQTRPRRLPRRREPLVVIAKRDVTTTARQTRDVISLCVLVTTMRADRYVPVFRCISVYRDRNELILSRKAQLTRDNDIAYSMI